MKFFTELNEEDRGQVGIGTLIIFIALVLVAAVAAGVLINTAGFLQASAESTGTDAQSQVSNQIDVVSATGSIVEDSLTSEVAGEYEDFTEEDRAVDELSMVVKKSPGSDPIDLEQATIQYSNSRVSETLVHEDTVSEAEAGSVATFSTEDTDGNDETLLTSTGDRVVIKINLHQQDGDATAPDDEVLYGILGEDENATLQIVDQSGATTVYGVNVPHTFGDRTVVAV